MLATIYSQTFLPSSSVKPASAPWVSNCHADDQLQMLLLRARGIGEHDAQQAVHMAESEGVPQLVDGRVLEGQIRLPVADIRARDALAGEGGAARVVGLDAGGVLKVRRDAHARPVRESEAADHQGHGQFGGGRGGAGGAVGAAEWRVDEDRGEDVAVDEHLIAAGKHGISHRPAEDETHVPAVGISAVQSRL